MLPLVLLRDSKVSVGAPVGGGVGDEGICVGVGAGGDVGGGVNFGVGASLLTLVPQTVVPTWFFPSSLWQSAEMVRLSIYPWLHANS